MSILRTHNLQNPDSSSINIVMDQGGNTNITGVTTVGGSNFHVPSGSVGIGTDNPLGELMVENTTQSHITVKTSGSNMAKFGSKGNDVYIGGTAGAADLIFKRNIISIDHPADSGTETLRITSDGYARLTTANARLEWTASSGSNPFIRSIGSGQQELEFNTGGSERLRITSTGKIGLDGMTNPVAKLHIGTEDDSALTAQTVFVEGAKTGYADYTGLPQNQLCLYDNTTSTAGSGGAISFAANCGGSQQTWIAAIESQRDSSTNDASNYAGSMVFWTRPAQSTPTEKLRITSGGLVRVPDNGKFTCGAGDDLQIFHNGSHSFIENNTGELLIRAKAGENSINCNPDGSIELFHDNSKKFETKSNGTQTTGRIFLNGTNGGFDYNNTAHTLEFLVANGTTHSELNSGAYVPQGTKNLGSNAKRWQTLYVSNGIDFASTSDASGMASEVFDDYEEGNWTPSIDNLTNTPTYDNLSGRYTKIGRVVHLMGFIQINGTTTPTYSNESSAWSLSGLPYARSTTGACGYVAARGIIHGQNFQYNGSFNDYGTTGVVNIGFVSTTALGLYVTGSGNGTIRGQVRRSSMKNTFIIEFDIVYNA